MNVFGIIGGLGPKTTCNFYLNLCSKFRKNCDSYPSIIIDNVSFPCKLEREIIQKSKEEELLPFLKESIRRLNKTQVDFIVIPCNTVHIFIDELRKESSVPILSIIKETIDLIKEKNYKKVGILATTKTIDSKLYENLMKENNMQTILPTKNEQKEVARIIIKILENKISEKERNSLRKIFEKLILRGSEVIVLACTDLQLLIKQEDFDIEIIDTLEVLIDSTFKKMIRGYEK